MTDKELEHDERFMALALAEAQEAFDAGEIPVGAVIVTKGGRVIARGHNLTETLTEVTVHLVRRLEIAGCVDYSEAEQTGRKLDYTGAADAARLRIAYRCEHKLPVRK